MAAVFILLWSSGFIGTRLGLPYAEPFTFLLVRFWIVTVLFLGVTLRTRASWPSGWDQIGHFAVAGVLMHAVYIGGVFSAINSGLQTGVTALLVSLQPILTACVVGQLFGEKVTARQWVGFILGLGGVALVVSDRLSLHSGGLIGIVFSACALVGITAGTLYQKKYCSEMDLRSGAVIQYAAAGVAMLLAAPVLEDLRIQWTTEFIIALAWLSLGLSLGAVTLLYVLIRRGKAVNVVSLFYLVPPCTSLMAYALFGETLDLKAVVGMAVATVGVALVNR